MKTKITQKLANLLLSFLGILLFVYPDSAIRAAEDALRSCAASIIPSLFPCMVLSGLIVRRKLLSPLERFLPMRQLFRLPSASACPFLLGALCGFPIGAKTTAELVRMGELTKEEAELTCAVSNNTGPAFAVSIAGGVFRNSRPFGWYLYLSQLLSALLVGLLFRKETAHYSLPSPKGPNKTKPPAESPIRSFAEALSSAASAVIPLCGYIVFFSVLCALVGELVTGILPLALLCSLLEFTAGIRVSSSLAGSVGWFLTGFSLGFSGLSVFVQSYSFTSPLGISLRKTLLFKGLQGCICGSMCVLFPVLFR